MMTTKLQRIESLQDIPAKYQGTPIGLLFEYHNLGRPYDTYSQAQLLIGMCMDNRKSMRIPDNFSYIIRSGGANLRYSEFKVSYAIAIGGVKQIMLICHDHCGMKDLISRKEDFIIGLHENAGWSHEQAEEHFMKLAPFHEIHDEIEFICSERERLQKRYPKVEVAAACYRVDDNKLYSICY